MKHFFLFLVGLPCLLTAQIKDLTVTTTTPNLCAPGDAMISVAATQTGVQYSVLNSANQMVAGPTAGDNNTHNFFAYTTATETYHVLAEATHGTAMAFDGADDYIAIDTLAFNYQNAYTFEAWVKHPDYVTGYYGSLFYMGAGNISDIEIYVRPNDLIVVYDRGKPSLRGNYFPAPPNDVWYHIAVAYDGTTTRLYYNGVEQTVYTGSANGAFSRTNGVTGTFGVVLNPLFTTSAAHQKYFDGSMDEIRIWSTARTQAEIAANASTCLTGTEAGLVAYYPLSGTPGTAIAEDMVGTNDGTLTTMDTNSAWVISDNSQAPCVSAPDRQLTQTATVTLVEIDTTVKEVSKGSTTLIPNQDGATYQWIDCQTLGFLSHAANYTPTVSGSYAVIIGYGGCTDTSNCHTVTVGGVGTDTEQVSRCTLAPNPTNGPVALRIGGAFASATIQVYTSLGQLISQQETKEALQEVALPETPGLYFLQVTVDGQGQVLRVVRY